LENLLKSEPFQLRGFGKDGDAGQTVRPGSVVASRRPELKDGTRHVFNYGWCTQLTEWFDNRETQTQMTVEGRTPVDGGVAGVRNLGVPDAGNGDPEPQDVPGRLLRSLRLVPGVGDTDVEGAAVVIAEHAGQHVSTE
jgi:hypothetical protein